MTAVTVICTEDQIRTNKACLWGYKTQCNDAKTKFFLEQYYYYSDIEIRFILFLIRFYSVCFVGYCVFMNGYTLSMGWFKNGTS